MSFEETNQRAAELFRAGQYDAASMEYVHCLELRESDAKTLSNLSACFAMLRDYAQAKDIALVCVKAHPTFSKGWSRLATAQHGLKEYNAAVTSYERCRTEGGPSHEAELSELKAVLAEGRGVVSEDDRQTYYFDRSVVQGTDAMKAQKYDDAVRAFTKALQYTDAAKASKHVILANRSAAHLKNGAAEQSLEDARDSIEANPEYARGHVRAGMALRQLKQLQDARDALDTALDMDSTNAIAREELRAVEKAIEDEHKAKDAQRAKEEKLRQAFAEARAAAATVDVGAPKNDAPKTEAAVLNGRARTVSYAYCRVCSEYGHTSRTCPMRKRQRD